MASHKLFLDIQTTLIRSSWARWRLGILFNRDYPIQDLPFYVNVTLRNIGNEEFPGGQISKFIISSGAYNAKTALNCSVKIPELSPKATVNICLGEMKTFLHGVVGYSCTVEPSVSSDTVTHYVHTDPDEPSEENGTWYRHSYITTQSEIHQANMDVLMLFVAVVGIVIAVRNLLIGQAF